MDSGTKLQPSAPEILQYPVYCHVTCADAALHKNRDSTHTNSHDDQETSHKLSKVDHSISATLHEIIWVGASSTDPIWQGSEDKGRDDEERVVFVEEGAREDDEEEAYCEDLRQRITLDKCICAE